MPKKKVLHIANWYPNKDKIHEGSFIKNHIDALSNECENTCIHIQVKPAGKILKVDSNSNTVIIYTRFFKYYRIQEWLTFYALLYFLFVKRKARGVDLINFHIATPLCRYLNFFNFFLRKKIVITEHWTAYRHFFYLPKSHKGLKRIKRIFFKPMQLITVSNQLGEDIKTFSKNDQLTYEVVPNVVDNTIFNFKESTSKVDPHFFMATNWSPEKRPLPILHALADLKFKFTLNIAGDGVLLEEMKRAVSDLKLQEQVTFLGRITPDEMAIEMQEATVFLHEANYETFSVVCAEALCCGCPIIAPNIPAIAEYLKPKYGILNKTFDKDISLEEHATIWGESIQNFLPKISTISRLDCANYYGSQFSKATVGKEYFSVLKKVLDEE